MEDPDEDKFAEMERIEQVELTKKTSEILAQVALLNRSFLITKNGKPCFTITPINGNSKNLVVEPSPTKTLDA